MNHQPVLVNEILQYAKGIKNVNWLLDLTFGSGGHSQALKAQFPLVKIMALDQDPLAVQRAKALPRLKKNFFIEHENFHSFESLSKKFKQKYFDLILLDLGPSTPQLKDPARGFSFYLEGPLDMRMNTLNPLKAEHIVNQWGKDELFNLFTKQGEIRHPQPVIRALLRERKKTPILSTKQLADLITKAIGWKKKGRHPASSYFLALRIEVNNELEGLKNSLPLVIQALQNGGRMFVLAFHSLEDRIVKQIFKNSCLKKEGFLVNKKVMRPSRKEVLMNPSSRSAVLRIFQKTKEEN